MKVKSQLEQLVEAINGIEKALEEARLKTLIKQALLEMEEIEISDEEETEEEEPPYKKVSKL